MNAVYQDAREIVHEERQQALASGCADEPSDTDFDVDDLDIEELQGYVSSVEAFLEAAEDIAQAIRLRQCAREEMIEVMKRMAGIREALISIAAKG